MACKNSIRNGVLFFFALCGFTSVAQGSGYGLFTQGASPLGQADAVVAHCDGASTLFFNPALMSKLPGTRVEIGTTLLFPTRHYTAPDGYTASTKDTVFTPSTFYLTHTFNDKISAGLAVFNPFGLGTDWGSNWGGAYGGQYIATKSELTTWEINPAVSYRILPALSVAAGLDVLLLNATLENKNLSTTYGFPTRFDVAQKFTGSGNGVGYNFGLSLELPYDISFGASYRSQVTIDVDGDFTADVLSQSVGGKTTVKLPQQVFAGVAYKPTDRMTLEAGMRWEDWSSFQQLQIQFAPNIFGLPSPSPSPRDWHSSYAFNLGGKFKINDTFSLMAGYLHGWNPVPDSTFDPSIPDSDTNLYTFGGEARYHGFTLGLAYGYQMQSARYKSDNAYAPTPLNASASADGTYETDLHLVGLSLGYTF